MSNCNEFTTYLTIDRPTVAEFKDRGSKFLAHAYQIENTADFKKIMQQLRKEHPKAVHHCFAYRLGTDNNSFRASDDGEPSGTAGRPILGQIDSRQLTNVLVVVVRYFGGSLLGVPGLINAYKMATSMALQLTTISHKPIVVKYDIEFDYTRLNDVMQVMKSGHCEILTRDIQLFCRITVAIPKAQLEEVISALDEINGVKFSVIN